MIVPCQRRAWWVFLYAACTITAVGQPRLSNSAPPLSPRNLEAVLFCDLVVRGRVLSIDVVNEYINDAMPMWPTPNPDATTRVAHVRMLVEEVLRGSAPDSLEFIVYVSLSHVRQNHSPTQQIVVGLIWGPDVLNGMYWMYGDEARFVLGTEGWEQQSGDLLLPDLAELRTILNRVAPRQVLADADVVITGRVVDQGVAYRTSPDGAEYAVITYRLADVDELKGDSVPDEIAVESIASGNFWPEWREYPTSPRFLKLEARYCFFLRRQEGRLFVLRGMSGVYELGAGGALRLPGRRDVGLSTGDISRSKGEK